MNRLSLYQRAEVIRCLVEGNSIRGTGRMTGRVKNTISRLLVEVGEAAHAYQDEMLRDLTCERIQCDEIWSFVFKKNKRLAPEEEGVLGYGDLWTFVALDAETKLAITWFVGARGGDSAMTFMADLRARLNGPIQMTTDGFAPYLEAVEDAFGADAEYAMYIKHYFDDPDAKWGRRLEIEQRIISGSPDPDHISTSFVERQNLTMRMGMRRFIRRTNGFSKKVRNHACAVALHFLHYNFARPHMALEPKQTPAMAAELADHVWSIEEIAGLIEDNPRFAQVSK